VSLLDDFVRWCEDQRALVLLGNVLVLMRRPAPSKEPAAA